MQNYVQAGQHVTLTAPAALASGAGVLVGGLFGVALTSAASGASVEVATYGVYDLPKATGAVSQGARLYWDNVAKVVTTTASGNSLIGAAIVAALSGDATVRVRLNGTTV